MNKHFVIIDVKLVWHGGMNLLSKEGAWDNLMRIRSAQAAAELLEIAKREGKPAQQMAMAEDRERRRK